MAEKPNQNWEARMIDSRGPKFRLDVNNPQMGKDGANVFLLYAVTDNKETHFSALSESGTYRLHNERTIEIVAGSKNNSSDTGILIHSDKGDIVIDVGKNGDVRISGRSVIVDANEDIDLKAGRNITLNAGSRILLRGLRVDAFGFLGNLVANTVGTWLQQIFKPTFVGDDYLRNPPAGDKFLSKSVVPGVGDSPIDTESSKGEQ
tara:strand:- start:21 stop:635 length:615 start_codon:yes stop_codon:yes gene_type:complete